MNVHEPRYGYPLVELLEPHHLVDRIPIPSQLALVAVAETPSRAGRIRHDALRARRGDNDPLDRAGRGDRGNAGLLGQRGEELGKLRGGELLATPPGIYASEDSAKRGRLAGEGTFKVDEAANTLRIP
jgi:hypothetical protein